MKKSRKIELLIEIAIFVVTILTFCYLVEANLQLETHNYFKIIASPIVLIAFIVIFLKGLRLYIVLFGHKINFIEYIRLYLKTTVVNIILPMKLGELYRWYSISKYIDSYSDSFIIVILDRFVDTLGLIVTALIFIFLFHIEMSSIYIIFIGFTITVFLAYWLFRPLYLYWNRFLIFHKSSEHTLQGLHFLDICNKAFLNVNKIVKGRFAILLMISIFAWIIELSGMVMWFHTGKDNDVSKYLSDVLTGKYNYDRMLFIFSIIGIAFVVEIVLLLIRNGKREKK